MSATDTVYFDTVSLRLLRNDLTLSVDNGERTKACFLDVVLSEKPRARGHRVGAVRIADRYDSDTAGTWRSCSPKPFRVWSKPK